MDDWMIITFTEESSFFLHLYIMLSLDVIFSSVYIPTTQRIWGVQCFNLQHSFIFGVYGRKAQQNHVSLQHCSTHSAVISASRRQCKFPAVYCLPTFCQYYWTCSARCSKNSLTSTRVWIEYAWDMMGWWLTHSVSLPTDLALFHEDLNKK